MAETFGDLVVRLGLDANPFQRGITDINRQMRTAESEFRSFGKAAQDSTKNLEFLETKSKSLTTQIELQTTKMARYEENIAKSSKRSEELGQEQAHLTEKVKNAEKALKNSIETRGKEDKITKQIKENYEGLSKELSDNTEMLNKSGRQLDNNVRSMNYAKGHLTDLEKELGLVDAEIGKLNDSLYQSGVRMETWGQEVQTAGKKIKEVGDGIAGVGKTLMTGLTIPLVGIGTIAVKSAMDFETAFTGVTKTIEMTAAETEKMRQGVISLSEELPHTKEAISEVASAAGQLGIQKENILSFSEVMLNMGVATNLSAGESAESIARFANITKMSQDDFQRLGSVIVHLGNNFATTESEIMEMGLRLAGAGDQIGLSEAQIMGFATALSAVGINAEAGGSAFSKVMIQMQVAAETGTHANKVLAETGETLRDLEMMASHNSAGFKDLAFGLGLTTSELKELMGSARDLEGFAEVMGVTVDEFVVLWEEDAAGAIQLFIEGLGDTEAAGESTIVMLEEMGLTEVRLRDSLTRLSGNHELLNSALSEGSKAWDENIALTKEAEIFNKSAANQMIVLKNRINSVAGEIGRDLTPKLVELGNKGVDFVTKKWAALTQEQKDNIVTMGTFVAAAGPVIFITGKLVSGIGSAAINIGGFAKGLGGLVKAFSASAKGASLLTSAVSFVTNPVGIATIALVAFGAALYIATKNSDELTTSQKMLGEEQERLSNAALEVNETLVAQSDVFREQFAVISDEVTVMLDSIEENAGEATEDITTALVSGFESMGSQVSETITKNTNEHVAILEELYNIDGVITKEEQDAIDSVRKYGEDRKELVDENQKRINEIVETASLERRAFTEDELADLRELQNQSYLLSESNMFEAQSKITAALMDFEKGRTEITKGSIDEVAKIIEEGHQADLEHTAMVREQALAREAQMHQGKMAMIDSNNAEELAAEKARHANALELADQGYVAGINLANERRTEQYEGLEKSLDGEFDLYLEHTDKIKEKQREFNEASGVEKARFGEELNDLAKIQNTSEFKIQEESFAQLQVYLGKSTDEQRVFAETSGVVGAEAATNWKEKLTDGIEKSIESVASTLEELGFRAVQTVKNKEAEFEQVGSNWGAGIDKGLSSWGSVLVGTARSMVDDVLSVMERELDIRSPSKKSERIFSFVGQGAVIGLEKEQGAIRRASAAFSKEALDQLGGTANYNSNSNPNGRSGGTGEQVTIYIQVGDKGLSGSGTPLQLATEMGRELERELRWRGVL